MPNRRHRRAAASTELQRRVVDWAEKIGVKVNEIHVRKTSRKWASCSTAGRLTFGADVQTLEADLVDYIVVHELLHLRVPNHSKLWKSLMRAYLGDYEETEGRLTLAGTHGRQAFPTI